MNNKNIERGANSLTGDHITTANPLETATALALENDLLVNQTHLAALQAATENNPDERVAATGTLVEQSLEQLQQLQTSIRNDRTRDNLQKLHLLGSKSEQQYEFITAKFSYALEANKQRFNEARENLFSTTMDDLSTTETALIPALAAALGKANATLLVETQTESKISLWILKNLPGLVQDNKLLDPLQDLAALTKEADERWSPDAFKTVQNCLAIEAAVNDFDRSIGMNKSQSLPEVTLNQLNQTRIEK